MKILAIDPGTNKTGFVIMDDTGKIYEHRKVLNSVVLGMMSQNLGVDAVYSEFPAPRHELLSLDIVIATYWIGRFDQELRRSRGEKIKMVSREDIKLFVCGRRAANDTGVRHALIQIYGGKEHAIGKKKNPGPLYSVANDEWAALAVGIYALKINRIVQFTGGN